MNETVQCVSCEHLRIEVGQPFCSHCSRPVTPGNMSVSRKFHRSSNACHMATVLKIATPDELSRVERIMHGYV